MPLPGFTAGLTAGAGAGRYRGSFFTRAPGGVVPQLPIGPIGGGQGNCCCVEFNWGWFGGGVAVALASSSVRGRVVTAGRGVNIGPVRVQCTECPQGDDECQCSCMAGGVPCAQRGSVTVCEPS